MSFASRFLAQPDSLPSHADGKPWGHCSVCLDIGGTTPVFGLSARQQAAIVTRFGAGVAGESEYAEGTFSIHVRRLGKVTFNVFDRRGWINTLDIGHEPDTVPVAGYGFAGIVKLAGDRSALLWTAEERDAEFLNLFENFFRVLVAYRALSQGGVLLHSSGLLCAAGALVFYGHSGAGKSTLAGLALKAGRRILSDDLNLIEAGDRPRVRRMPFAGEHGQSAASNEVYPLSGLYRLRKGENRIEALSPGAALATMMACAPFVNRDPFRLPKLIENLEGLTHLWPVSEFAFGKEEVQWGLLDEAAAQA